MQKTIEQQVKDKAETAKKEWLRQHHFNAEGYTYIVKGETYSRKDTLKKAGFYFDPVLLWHSEVIPLSYENEVFSIHWKEIVSFSAWGEGHFFENSKELVKSKVYAETLIPNTEWIAEDELRKIEVFLIRRKVISNQFGLSSIFTFQTSKNHILSWITKKDLDIEIGQKVLLSAKVKGRTEYHGIKQTQITRAKIEII